MKPEGWLSLYLLMASPCFASSEHELCDRAALRAAERHGIPPQVMLAITRAETGRNRDGVLSPWPWSLNVNGQSYWFDTPFDAASHARAETDSGQTNVDLGCFQLNWRWHGENFPTIEEMLDPTSNAEYAAMFLVDLHARRGNWVDAVAAYHSNTPEYAERYIEKVEAILLSLSGEEMLRQTEESLAEPATFPNLFPLLQAGEAGSLASLVPTQAARGSMLLKGP